MKAYALTFYTYEFDKIHAIHVHEWLLEKAKKLEISGGCSFRAVAGFGRNKLMYEEHFFELGSNVPISTHFFLSKKELKNFLKVVEEEGLELFYSYEKIEIGRTKPSKV